MPLTVRSFDQLRDAATAMGADPSTHFLGGGTLLMRRVNEGDVSVSTLVRTTDRRFADIRASGGRIFLGAGATMAEVADHPDLRFLRPVANSVGSPTIRNMATIGGNLFARSPHGDFAVALLALGATVMLADADGVATIELAGLLAARERREPRIVTGVSFALPDPSAFRFVKTSRRNPHGAAVLSIAALLPIIDGRLTGVRIAYGAMAPSPIRVPAVERSVEGRALDAATIATAAAAAAEGCAPEDDAIASAWYRRSVVAVHLRRLLEGER